MAWDTKDYGWGSKINTPDYSGAFSSGKSSETSSSSGGSKGGGSELASTIAGLFEKANERKYQKQMSDSVKIGETGASGKSGQVLDNLSVVYPQQHAPVYVPGVEGKKGFGSTIGGIAGAIGGSLIPGVGTGLGATLGSGVGGFFG